MSMWLNMVKLPAEEARRASADDAAVEALFFSDDDDSGDAGDFFGTDYRTLLAIAEALEIDLDDGASWLSKAVGNGAGDPIGYEFCYGPGFIIEVDEVKSIAAGLATEDWYAETVAFDDDENLPGLLRFFAGAAAEGKAIIGGVS